ncbi:MAG TPA: chromosomal replication initiator protein DnaA [Candidatus Wunengus sp. YC61]|uniref:chromosomal replication initiator protein DnaA n=1 Tax=Candidatus Wunengus sp. YC61 TaxID=3367698 RepID=UPI00402864BD
MDIYWGKNIKFNKEKISPQNFDTWIKPIKIASVSGNDISLSVPNKFFRDWIIENYLSIIKNSLSSVAGIDFNIEFTLESNNSGKCLDSTDKIVADHGHKADIHTKKTSKTLNHPTLNANYSFDRFVVGPCNRFAHAASVAVAEKPAKNYNPLFIYGGVGLGKTHLLNSIGLMTLSLHLEMNVIYASAEAFMNELINSIRYDKMQKFREKFRNIDCFLIDDIQFIAGKGRTQEEFFHTFNTLHDSGKQIVVTSDKFPKDIPDLEERLRSRFEWGLIADIQPPEIETKIAIIEKKAQENNISIASNAAHYIASIAQSNIRELEGFLVRVSAYSSLTGRAIDVDLVKEILRKIQKQSKREEITIDEIVKAVSSKFNIKISDIKSQHKNKNLVLPRQVIMYLSRKLTNSSFPDIGEKIGGRDHSTVIYSNNKIKKLLEIDVNLRNIIDDIENSLVKS